MSLKEVLVLVALQNNRAGQWARTLLASRQRKRTEFVVFQRVLRYAFILKVVQQFAKENVHQN